MFPEYAFREAIRKSFKLVLSPDGIKHNSPYFEITDDSGLSMIFKGVFNEEKTKRFIADEMKKLEELGVLYQSSAPMSIDGKYISVSIFRDQYSIIWNRLYSYHAGLTLFGFRNGVYDFSLIVGPADGNGASVMKMAHPLEGIEWVYETLEEKRLGR